MSEEVLGGEIVVMSMDIVLDGRLAPEQVDTLISED